MQSVTDQITQYLLDTHGIGIETREILGNIDDHCDALVACTQLKLFDGIDHHILQLDNLTAQTQLSSVSTREQQKILDQRIEVFTTRTCTLHKLALLGVQFSADAFQRQIQVTIDGIQR